MQMTCVPLTCPIFHPVILHVRHDHRSQHVAFFVRDHTFKNMPCSPIWDSFCLVFASLLAYASIRTRTDWSVPICTHTHHFLPNTPKHDVRGNFPGHRAQILTCETLNVPCLPCFCVPRGPCTPTHPSAPIRTHLNLFVPVFTLNWNVYMYNLIEK